MAAEPNLVSIDELLVILTTLRNDLRYFKNRIPTVSKRHTFIAGGEQVAASLLEHFTEVAENANKKVEAPRIIVPGGY